MIFVGDVAIAHHDQFTFSGFPEHLLHLPWCVNLEGAITDSGAAPGWGVYNSSTWTESFEEVRLGPVFLGNNHIHDVADGVNATLDRLAAFGLPAFGAGRDEKAAARPIHFEFGNLVYVLLGYGWPVIGCRQSKRDSPGVNRLEGQRIRVQLEAAMAKYPDARFVVVLHGNYEFERYPQPGHRRLARELIDMGAYAVVGHHPHIVGPVERYRGRTIAYSLGNWAFSYGRFFDGRLKFHEISFHQIALELGDNGDTVHHARFTPPALVEYVHSEPVDNTALTLQAEFEGMSDQEYVGWFKAHRLKRKGLPVYLHSDDTLSNRLRDFWVRTRQVVVDLAAKTGLKPMRSTPVENARTI